MLIDLRKIFLVPAPNKIVGLDLVPFSEMVVNHCCRSKRRRDYHSILLSSQNDQAGVKRNFRLAKFLTSRHVLTHRVIFYMSNTLRKLIIGLRDSS